MATVSERLDNVESAIKTIGSRLDKLDAVVYELAVRPAPEPVPFGYVDPNPVKDETNG